MNKKILIVVVFALVGMYALFAFYRATRPDPVGKWKWVLKNGATIDPDTQEITWPVEIGGRTVIATMACQTAPTSPCEVWVYKPVGEQTQTRITREQAK